MSANLDQARIRLALVDLRVLSDLRLVLVYRSVCYNAAMCAVTQFVYVSRSEAATISFGQHLGARLLPGDIVLLNAPFGAGKTHLTKGIGAAWGIPAAEIHSPSFVLVNEYEADAAHHRLPILHVDLYRVETAHELATIGLDDLLEAPGLCIIEWAERLANLIPAEHLAIQIAVLDEHSRQFELTAHGSRYAMLIHDLAQALAEV